MSSLEVAPPADMSSQGQPAKKKRIRRQSAIDKKEKGLRHFAVRVCQKVESKMTTTYNEVADELVHEVLAPPERVPGTEGESDRQYDEKNIRRRVYDALNVLLAMDIIEKKKKEIRWKGLPDGTSSAGLELHTPETLRAELRTRREKLDAKEKHLAQLQEHNAALRALVDRNSRGRQSNAHRLRDDPASRVRLPFLLVDAKQGTNIELEIADHAEEVTFTLTGPFCLHDDMDILRSMGMHRGPGFVHACTDPANQSDAKLDRVGRPTTNPVVQGTVTTPSRGEGQQDPASTDLLLLSAQQPADANVRWLNQSPGPSPPPDLDGFISTNAAGFSPQPESSSIRGPNPFIRVSN